MDGIDNFKSLSKSIDIPIIQSIIEELKENIVSSTTYDSKKSQ